MGRCRSGYCPPKVDVVAGIDVAMIVNRMRPCAPYVCLIFDAVLMGTRSLLRDGRAGERGEGVKQERAGRAGGRSPIARAPPLVPPLAGSVGRGMLGSLGRLAHCPEAGAVGAATADARRRAHLYFVIL